MDIFCCMWVFVVVVECGSFVGVVEQLQVLVVMVGKYIQQLEVYLGIGLL